MDVISVARTPKMVECLRQEGEGCPRCDGSGYRPRKVCAGCGEPAKALQAARSAKSWEEARSLPLYCSGCNPRFAGTGLDFFLD
jgi:NAD-dependent SIR2 family protein deacetylase